VIATIDGRRTTSVGATMVEAARVAQALGMQDSINLDGGGSTTMVVNGALANVPSGSAERAVGDALVYLPSP
jgi:exopolysaccharide biosynthesis protein